MYNNTKWNKEKIEDIIINNGFEILKQEPSYYELTLSSYGKKKSLMLTLNKSSINVNNFGSYWKGIRSYKNLNHVLEHYGEELRKDIFHSTSQRDRFLFNSKK